MQIWQTVMKRWKLNSWDDVSQLGREDDVRREKSQKWVSVGLSTVGKKNVLMGNRVQMCIINSDFAVIGISVVAEIVIVDAISEVEIIEGE